VAVGGDGTVHEVANGLLGSANSRETLMGIISTGTGSDFNRTAGIPRGFEKSCSCLTGTGRLQIDAGIVEYTKNGQKQSRFFVNSAGAGFDAAVVEATESMPKYFGGTIPYVFGLLRTLIGYRNKNITLCIGDKTQNMRVLSILVANGKYIGGGMKIAPLAELNENCWIYWSSMTSVNRTAQNLPAFIKALTLIIPWCIWRRRHSSLWNQKNVFRFTPMAKCWEKAPQPSA
jgi:diacylglycerol kinase family enzyme